jgi:hypothetical protein
MQKFDRDAWELYKRVGGMLLPYITTPDIWGSQKDPEPKQIEYPLSPWFLATRPAFGCIAYGTNPEIERIEKEEKAGKRGELEVWIPKFQYFWKYDKKHMPWEIQKVAGAGDIYKLTVWWDKPGSNVTKKWGKPTEFGLFVAEDGHIQVLKHLETKIITAKSKKPQVHSDTRIPQRVWVIPGDLKYWAETHGTTAQVYLANIFTGMAQRWEGSSLAMVRVSVSKDNRYACFGIDPHRLPYFFKDRDYVLTPSGHRKPIGHLVRPFTDKRGVEHGFKWRGLREFTWAGYKVTLTVPGLHHVDWEAYNAPMHDARRLDPKEGPYEGMKRLGEAIRKNMEGEEIYKVIREPAKK